MTWGYKVGLLKINLQVLDIVDTLNQGGCLLWAGICLK